MSIGSRLWSDTAVSYLFDGGTQEVMSPSGPTGVLNLGAVSFTTSSGGFWNDTIALSVRVGQGFYTCSLGGSGGVVTRTGRGTIRFDLPIAWSGARSRIADFVRERFERAVRIAVTGVP